MEIIGGGDEERTEQQEAAEAELVEVEVLDAGHHGQQQQRQDLRQVERAAEERAAAHGWRAAEHAAHVVMMQLQPIIGEYWGQSAPITAHLAQQQPRRRVQRDGELPHVLLRREVADRGYTKPNKFSSKFARITFCHKKKFDG